jgi:dihydroxyacid dehydratase/phosphogluconate dehydratase
MRRAQWSALGLTDEDPEKPKIAIVNSSSQLASCFASCDKTTPGQLMAAGRLNIPTIIVGCGYQPSGVYKGESVDFEDIFRFAGHVNAGRMTVEERGAGAEGPAAHRREAERRHADHPVRRGRRHARAGARRRHDLDRRQRAGDRPARGATLSSGAG